MDIFNLICGACSIVGLFVSIFTASQVIKIKNIFNVANKYNNSKIVNKGKGNTYSGSYAGRDNIHESRNREQK